jgi:uncharacterized membrane protein YgdD (TMEM256/DUF423 family)
VNGFRFHAVLAALFGLAGVAIGAFGAHGLSGERAKHLVDVGAHYHITHTLAAIGALAFWRWGAPRARFAALFFFAGLCLFSGSLYALALGAPAIIGVITPIGGVLLMIGWALLAWAGLQLPRNEGGSS